MPDMMKLLPLAVFCFAFLFRYTRTVVGILTYIFFKAKPVLDQPRFSASNATVIVPTTFKSETELTHCLRRIHACNSACIYVVTAIANVPLVQQICSLKAFKNVKVLGVEKLNKRQQMVKAIKEVSTPIMVFADDDVFWPTNYLDYLLAIFESPNTGAGGTRQRTRRNNGFFTSFWNFLGISYLERRVWNNITTNAIDGSISTLSGRTSAYRTEILKSEKFYAYFLNDNWRGLPLNTDDDKCLTRYLHSHGWDITIQSDPRSVIETNLEDSPKYLSQCSRWARAHWRGNFTVMENETYWCSPRYWWGLYVIYVGQFQTPAFLFDGLLFGLLALAVHGTEYAIAACIALGAWISLTKNIKMIPHFWRYPQDIVWMPFGILFSYAHGFLNIHALLTLTNTAWGSQSLEKLAQARAKDGDIVPLLSNAMKEGQAYQEPELGFLVGEDYFSAHRIDSGIDLRKKA